MLKSILPPKKPHSKNNLWLSSFNSEKKKKTAAKTQGGNAE